MKTYNIFWTGGFDSTYRVAEILASGLGVVRPIYLIDPDRKSFPLELYTISRLRSMLISRFDCRTCLMPVEVYLKDDFPVKDKIAFAYAEIRRSVHIGSQYQWLAQFCEETVERFGKIELSAERINPPVGWYTRVFDDPYISPPTLKDDSAKGLFGNYSFPVLHLTEIEMELNAKKLDFYEILQNTWFCHWPVGGRACGVCYPCRLVKAGRNYAGYAFIGRERQLISSAYRKVKKLFK